MRCPSCGGVDSRVVDSRSSADHIRRRRECLDCAHRFTTYERWERPSLWIVKKDGTKQPFSEHKVLHGIALACRKRPISNVAMDEAVQRVRAILEARRENELPSNAVGEAVLETLRQLDDVAYIRFASVYEAFDNVEGFVNVIRPLRSDNDGGEG